MNHAIRIPQRFDDLTDVLGHIVDAHHTFTRAELARLFTLADRAVIQDGSARPELPRVHELVAALADELLPHLEREERIVFPRVIALEAAANGARPPCPPLATLHRPIRALLAGHERVRDIFVELHRMTGDLTVPTDASGALASLYVGLATLERDLREHTRLESDVVFPLALDLERRVGAHAAEDGRSAPPA